jgi:hypothetical protein
MRAGIHKLLSLIAMLWLVVSGGVYVQANTSSAFDYDGRSTSTMSYDGASNLPAAYDGASVLLESKKLGYSESLCILFGQFSDFLAAESANLATTPLRQTVTGVADDALVHFAPQEYSVIQPGAGGQVFSFQYGDISHLTPRQIETLIGPMSIGGETGGASVMHVLDAPINSAVEMPGAVVTEFPEYIFDYKVPVSGAIKVQ